MTVSRPLLVMLLLPWLPQAARAEALPLIGRSSIMTDRGALIKIGRPKDSETGAQVASLFIGNSEKSFFAPYPERSPPQENGRDRMVTYSTNGAPAELVRHLIAAAEAGKLGYDAINYGAKRLPVQRPTSLSIAEIYAWIDATPGQPHAIGRYQFIPSTLRRLVAGLDIDPRTRFSPQVQDRLADVLLAEAGLDDLSAGRIGRRSFMNNLAKIWAGLPSSTGRSHYDGYAGNRATMTWARFEAEMTKIFPG